MEKNQPILVTGATGSQGGAVARLLLDRGRAVRAMTRDPDAPAARALAERGADVVVGNMDDPASLDAALRGTGAVFAMSTPASGGTDAETRQGITVADAARRAGAFLVFTSVASADKATGIPHFDSKFAVETHIRTQGIEATILAPVFFMENVLWSKAQLAQGVYPSLVAAKRMLQQVAVADIAAAAVAALSDPARYAGRRFDLAGDEMTGEAYGEVLSKVIGRPLQFQPVPIDFVRRAMGEDTALMVAWFDRVGYAADRAALAREFPDVRWTPFETWARSIDWKGLLGS